MCYEDTVVHAELYKGHVIHIHPDPCDFGPWDDAEHDENLVLVHYHRDFWVERKDIIKEDTLRLWYHVYYYQQVNFEDLDEYDQSTLAELTDRYWIFPVSAYIHGGVMISMGRGGGYPDQQWDVSHVGAVLVAKEEWPDEEKAAKAGNSHVKYWDAYLTGDVYGYEVMEADEMLPREPEESDLEDFDGDVLDSCWGFAYIAPDEYGTGPGPSYQDALDGARSTVDYYVKKAEKNNDPAVVA